MIFAMPVVQLIILPFAVDYEMRNINLSVVDHDHSEYSRKLINKITSTGYFRLVNVSPDYDSALEIVDGDEADLIIAIPEGFEHDLIRDNRTKIMLSANAIAGQTAGLAVAYSNTIIKDFNNDIRLEWIQQPRMNALPAVEITSSNWFNPGMNYRYFFCARSSRFACNNGWFPFNIFKHC
jgi:ABC-2 type transport system permease protein